MDSGYRQAFDRKCSEVEGYIDEGDWGSMCATLDELEDLMDMRGLQADAPTLLSAVARDARGHKKLMN